MKVIGICGSSGSGKTEALRILGSDGMPVLNCDEVSRQVMQPGSACCRELCEAFGKDILLADGTLDRKKLFELTVRSDTLRIFTSCGPSTPGWMLIKRLRQLSLKRRCCLRAAWISAATASFSLQRTAPEKSHALPRVTGCPQMTRHCACHASWMIRISLRVVIS